jgi:hypothetical protein
MENIKQAYRNISQYGGQDCKMYCVLHNTVIDREGLDETSILELQNQENSFSTNLDGGPGSSVGIATDYGLDGPGIESRRGRDFSHTSRPALRLTQPPVQWVPGLSRG